MTTGWMLPTYGDPLGAVREFLAALWVDAGLDGMVAPCYREDDLRPAAEMFADPRRLDRSDPFVPYLLLDTVRMVSRLAQEGSSARYAAIVRSCEARALQKTARRQNLNLESWLVVGVDCLASFSAEDYAWRTEKAGNGEQLTRENLRFARQGGISTYRYRRACQVCLQPEVAGADFTLGVVGLPVKEAILVLARDEATARAFNLAQLTAGPADPDLISQRRQVIARLIDRRSKARSRDLPGYPSQLPSQVSDLIRMLEDCAPCRKCLEACPVYSGELSTKSNGERSEAVLRWLRDCVACGECEEACPQHRPIMESVARIISN